MDTQDSVKTPAQDAVKKDTGAPISSSGSSVSSRFFVLNFMKNHQELQTHVYQTYKMLRYVLAFGYIISALLKIPALYEMFVLAYQVYQSKKEQAAASDQKEPPPPPCKCLLNRFI